MVFMAKEEEQGDGDHDGSGLVTPFKKLQVFVLYILALYV